MLNRVGRRDIAAAVDCTIVALILVGVGLYFLIVYGSRVSYETNAVEMLHFTKTDCVTGQKRMEHKDVQGTARPGHRASIDVVYKVAPNNITINSTAHDLIGGQFLPNQEHALRFYMHYQRGHTYPCWYDPKSNTTVSLHQGNAPTEWHTYATLGLISAVVVYVVVIVLASVFCFYQIVPLVKNWFGHNVQREYDEAAELLNRNREANDGGDDIQDADDADPRFPGEGNRVGYA